MPPWEDPIVKERHFTTPLCLETAGRKRPADNHSSEYRPEPAKHPKGGSKGAGKQKRNKGAGKGKGNRGKGGCTRTTPDGRSICYAFNDVSGCSKKGCKFLHVCGVCFVKDVSMQACTHTGGRG